jgi:hypothetical protein
LADWPAAGGRWGRPGPEPRAAQPGEREAEAEAESEPEPPVASGPGRTMSPADACPERPVRRGMPAGKRRLVWAPRWASPAAGDSPIVRRSWLGPEPLGPEPLVSETAEPGGSWVPRLPRVT